MKEHMRHPHHGNLEHPKAHKGLVQHHIKRKKGGRTDMWVSGNPDVEKEAEEKGPGSEKMKRGGRAKKHHRMSGGKVSQRMDKVARKSGGRVGSDLSPISSAQGTHTSESLPKSDGGN